MRRPPRGSALCSSSAGSSRWAILAGGLAVAGGVGVGVVRGLLVRVWRGEDGKVYKQGTPVTIGLFIAVVLVKVGTDVWAYTHHLTRSGSVGQTFFLMALMTALQISIVTRRAARLRGEAPAETDPVLAAAAPVRV